MSLHKYFLVFICILSSSKVWCFELPTQLDQEGKNQVINVLSFGTLTKLNSNPYPLGGYSGLEIGFSQEAISSNSISKLGPEESSSGYFTYSNLSIGKGFYSNWDIFLNFAPFGQRIQSQIFGVLLRWCFFNRSNYRFSAVLHTSGANIQNKYFSEGSGYDLVSSATWKNFDFYYGLGPSTVTATFANSLLADGINPRTSITALRNFAGVNYEWENYFINTELHRVSEMTYSMKLGLRF